MMVRTRLIRATVAVVAMVLAGAALSACVVGTGIAGTVTSGGTGQAGLKVAVYASGDDSTPIRTVVTGAGGSYAITDLIAGTYHVRLDGTSWYDGTATADPLATPVDVVITANQVKTITVDTAFTSGTLSGSVWDANSDLVSGATVDAISAVDRTTVVATTTSKGLLGRYTFGAGILPVGNYVLRASKPGYGTVWGLQGTSPADSTIEVTADNSAGADLQFLGADATLHVTVSNGHTPIAGSTVAVYLGAPTVATDRLVTVARTRADGTVVIGGLNRIGYRVLVIPPAPYLPAAYGTTSDPDVADSTTIDLSGGSATVTQHVSVCGPSWGPEMALPGWDGTDKDLRGCDLTSLARSATLTGADIDGADLSAADLRGVTSGRVVGVPKALPTGWHHIGGYLVGRYARLWDVNATDHASLASVNLEGADLYQADFSGSDLHDIDLAGANLDQTQLPNVDLTGADLRGASMSSVNVDGADLRGAEVKGLRSTYLNGDPAGLDPTWKIIDGTLMAPGVDLTVVPTYGGIWTNVDLAGADLHGTYFEVATISDSNLRGADLRNVQFFATTFTSVDLTDADLTGATDNHGIFASTFSNITWSNTTCPDGSNSAERSPESCSIPQV